MYHNAWRRVINKTVQHNGLLIILLHGSASDHTKGEFTIKIEEQKIFTIDEIVTQKM